MLINAETGQSIPNVAAHGLRDQNSNAASYFSPTLVKLRVNNRVQAVAQAISMKMIRAKITLVMGTLYGLVAQVQTLSEMDALSILAGL